MTFRHQHIRSSEKGRRPIPTDLIDGQLAVNFGDDAPGMFFKSEEGQILKSGPTYIGTTPPPLVKYAEYAIGELWFDLNAGILKIWTVSGWRETSAEIDGDLKGQPGEKGEVGEEGKPGYNGQDGTKGQKGDDGGRG